MAFGAGASSGAQAGAFSSGSGNLWDLLTFFLEKKDKQDQIAKLEEMNRQMGQGEIAPSKTIKVGQAKEKEEEQPDYIDMLLGRNQQRGTMTDATGAETVAPSKFTNNPLSNTSENLALSLSSGASKSNSTAALTNLLSLLTGSYEKANPTSGASSILSKLKSTSSFGGGDAQQGLPYGVGTTRTTINPSTGEKVAANRGWRVSTRNPTGFTEHK